MNLKNIKYQIHDLQYTYRKQLRFIPLIIILFYLFLNRDNNLNSDINSFDMVKHEITNTFIFDDINRLINTTLLIIIVLSTYNYWLKQKKVVRRNKGLVQGIMFVLIVLVFSVHIRASSMLGELFDWAFFFICAYLILASSWFTVKLIDSLDLESDLYCWALRIIGLVLLGVGLLITFTGLISIGISAGTDDYMTSSNLLWIFGACLTLIGAFTEFRSFRRYPSMYIHSR